MFELNGQKFTLEQIQDAANKSNLSLEEYLAKSGITRVLESSPDFQNPTMPGAVVGENQAPDTESKSENTSSEPVTSAKVNIPNIPFPVTVTTDKRSTDGMSYDDIYQQEINNIRPRFSQAWQDAKAFAVDWYRKNVATLSDRVTAAALMRSGKLNGIPSKGRLNFFYYDPKYKQVLPLYDRFPLVLPLETIPGGFMGMNFHYIRPVQRISLLNNLQRYASGGMKSTTRIDATYDGIKNVRIARNTIKKYLYSHVRSSFLRVDFDEAALAVMLPVQQFRKGSPY